MTALLTDNLPLLAGAPNGIKKLRELILELAVRGKLVPQDPSDEPASELLKRIHTEKQRLLADSKARKQKELAADALPEPPYGVPSGWKWQSIDSVLIVTGGVTLGRKLAGRKLVSRPYLRVANVQRGYLVLDQIKEVEIPDDEIEKYLLLKGDLLITEGGDWDKVGRTAIWRDELPECLHQNHVFRARAVTTEWEPRWAEIYLNSGTAREYFAGSSKQTTNLASINMTQLRACAFPLPPLFEQHRIVAKVDQLMTLCDRLEAQQADAESAHAQLVQALLDSLTQASDATDLTARDGGNAENAGAIFGLASWQRLAEHFHTLFTTEPSIDALKQTLLQLAVMGKLVPQDPNDEPASELLKRIAEEKTRLVAEGKLKKQKPLAEIAEAEKPFELPMSWKWVRLEEIAQVGTGATPLRTNPKYFESATISWVTSGETSQDFIRETEQKVAPLALTETNLTVYPRHTLIIAMYGQGKTRGQISELLIDACTNQACAAIQLLDQDESHRRYVKYFFVKSYDDIRLLSAGGAQPNLNLGKIKETVLPLPPAIEQHRIVAKVDQLMALCDQLKTRLTQARQLNQQLASTLIEQTVA